MADPLNAEIEAMSIVAGAIEHLSRDAQLRVCRWLTSYVTETDRGQERAVSTKWRLILDALETDEFGHDELMSAAGRSGQVLKRAQCRAQMHHYLKKGWVEQTGEGRFRLTSLGREKAA